jgi:uncharacterized protein
VAVVLDTGIVYAAHDRRDDWHERAAGLFERERGLLVLPAPIIAEVDHFLGKELGRLAQLTFYRDLSVGAYLIADLPREKYARVEELNRQFADLALGFVDAAVIAISESLALPRIATTDRRHFTPLAAALSLELLP